MSGDAELQKLVYDLEVEEGFRYGRIRVIGAGGVVSRCSPQVVQPSGATRVPVVRARLSQQRLDRKGKEVY
jgi:hypothetical protein